MNTNPEINRFKWCGHQWETCMESGRPIHPDDPRYYIDGRQVAKFNDAIHLSLAHNPISFIWGWYDKNVYAPDVACGLIKSVEAFPVNTSFECDVMMPKGNNLWFSFWLTACDSWPPEIDVFEGYTDQDGSYYDKLAFHWKFPFLYKNLRFESNVHYTDSKGVHRQIGPKGIHERYLKRSLSSSWNHFKCCWKEDFITFSINDVVVRTIKNKKTLSKMKTSGMWVIFNIWPNDKFDTSKDGDIMSFVSPFKIRNFKVNKI